MLCRAQASRPASLRSRVLVPVASSVAVAVFAAITISAAMRFPAPGIPTLLLRGAAFNAAHFLRPGLWLAALKRTRLTVAVRRALVPPLDRCTVFLAPTLDWSAVLPAHFLWPGLWLAALKRARLIVAVRRALIPTFDGSTVFLARIAFCGAGRTE